MPNISRTKTWVANETLTAADLNAEVDGVIQGINDNALNNDNLSQTDDYLFGSVVMGAGLAAGAGDGKLHVHVNTAGTIAAHGDANDLTIESSSNTGMTILSGTTATGSVHFGDSGDNDIGKIVYDHNANDMAFTVGATADLLLLTSSAATFLSTLTVGVNDTGHDVKFFGASAGAYMEWDESADQLRIMGASADATTSTGKLLLATSLTDVNANDVLGKIDFQAPHETGADATAIAASIQAIAQGTFAAGLNATDLIFYTGHSEAATEKLRITSQGEIGIGGANYGTDGQVLTSGGAGAAPAWESPTVGDITGVTAGVGLSGGGTTGTLTLALDLSELSAVTPTSGDSLSTLDNDGANEQRTTTDALATLFSGTGLTASSAVIGVDAAQTGITSLLATDIKIGEDDQTKIDFETADEIHFDTANIERMIIDAAGKVGIGVAPTSTFHIQNSEASSYAIEVDAADGSNLFGVWEDSDGTGQVYLRDAAGDTQVLLDSGGNSYFKGGDVGIGTTSINESGFGPGSSVLSISGAAQNDFGVLELRATDLTDDNRLGEIRFVNMDAHATTPQAYAGIRAYRDGADNATALGFYTEVAGGAFGLAMTIDNAGKVGIGKAPTEALTVTSATNATGIVIENTSQSPTLTFESQAGSPNTAARDWDIITNQSSFGDFQIRVGASQGAAPGTLVLTADSAGGVYINETVNPNMTIGLTINQAANYNEAQAWQSSEVTHGVTDSADTNTYGAIWRVGTADGGVQLRGYTEVTQAAELWGVSTTGNTTHTAAGRATIGMWALKKSGTGVTGPAANENMFAVYDGGVGAAFIVDKEGDLFANGSATTVYDDHDDVALLSAFDATIDPSIMKRKLQADWEDFESYNEQSLIDLGIFGGKRNNVDPSQRGLINYTGLSRLTVSAVRQVGRAQAQMQAQLDAKESRIAALESQIKGLLN